jgi:hypothetical protein
MKARDFIKNALKQTWEDMETDPDFWPEELFFIHLDKITVAQRELAAIEAMPDRGVTHG